MLRCFHTALPHNPRRPRGPWCADGLGDNLGRKKTCADVAKEVKVNIGAKLISKLEELKEAAVSDQIAEVAAVMVV